MIKQVKCRNLANCYLLVIICLVLLGCSDRYNAASDNTAINIIDAANTDIMKPVSVSITTPVISTRISEINHIINGAAGSVSGVTWHNHRFHDNNDGTVTDNLTGLVWLKDANCFDQKNWVDAVSCVRSLASGICGLSDNSSAGQWRLPNRKELKSLVDSSCYNPSLSAGHPFSNIQPGWYWSSSTDVFYTSLAWYVYRYFGGLFSFYELNHFYIWPVRAAQYN